MKKDNGLMFSDTSSDMKLQHAFKCPRCGPVSVEATHSIDNRGNLICDIRGVGRLTIPWDEWEK
jgi:transcription elongation factor Elf1